MNLTIFLAICFHLVSRFSKCVFWSIWTSFMRGGIGESLKQDWSNISAISTLLSWRKKWKSSYPINLKREVKFWKNIHWLIAELKLLSTARNKCSKNSISKTCLSPQKSRLSRWVEEIIMIEIEWYIQIEINLTVMIPFQETEMCNLFIWTLNRLEELRSTWKGLKLNELYILNQWEDNTTI